MARDPKPWFREGRGIWCVTVGGVRHNLGPDRAEAMQRFYALMRRPKPVRKVAAASLPAVADAFLEWCKQHRSAATFRWYLDHLQDFLRKHPGLTFERMSPLLVQQWAADGHDNVNTRRNRLRAVKRCLRWAAQNELIDRNPLVGIEIPAGQPREVYVGPEEFERLLSVVHDDTFVELLRVTYETGCRPQESLRLEARHCDFEHARWVFPRGEAKVKSRPRVVYLSEYALAVTRRLAAASPTGLLFRNSAGQPWTPLSVNCAFDRIQTRMGRAELERRGLAITDAEAEAFAATLRPTRTSGGSVLKKTHRELLAEARKKLAGRRARELAPRYSLYGLRHAWATNALQSGIDALTVAVLMGHSNPSQLACTYQHLSHNPGHLLSQARRVGARASGA